MRLSTITICLFVFWSCLPATAQEPIAIGQPQPVVETAPQPVQVTPQAEPQATLAPQPQPYTYDPANYNQWDPKNPETFYPAAGPNPTPPLGPCAQRTGLGYDCPKNWYLDQRVRIMYHPTTRAPTYSFFYDPHLNSTGSMQIDFRNAGKSGSLGMEPSAGYQITIGKYLGRDIENRDQFIEFTYYGMNQWSSRFPINSNNTITLTNSDDTGILTQTTSGNLYSMFGGKKVDADVSGFNRAETQTLEYDSRWDNFELNLRLKPRRRHDSLIMHKNASWTREVHEGWLCSYLMGVRGVTLDEYFSFSSEGDMHVSYVDGVAVDYDVNVGGRYRTKTRNDMFGLQIGMDCIHQKGPWNFGAEVKAGVFINFADQHSRAYSWGADTPTTEGDPWSDVNVDFDNFVRTRDIASVAELGFMTSYQIRKNLIVSAHYDLSWFSGLVLAPEQFEPTANAPARVTNNGNLLMQSLSLGVEILW